jgi:dCMP deaminase
MRTLADDKAWEVSVINEFKSLQEQYKANPTQELSDAINELKGTLEQIVILEDEKGEFKMNKKNNSISEIVNRLSWDSYFIEIAKTVALRSHDKQTQVGAVLVNERNHIISTGYNGFPPGGDDAALPVTRPEKYPYMIHAEMNAMLHSEVSLKGATLYVTHSPCMECSKNILTSGITRVVYDKTYSFEGIEFLRKFGFNISSLN